MTKTFRPYSPDQLLLLPPSLREWLPANHPVYFVNDLVATLDLEPILSSYGEERHCRAPLEPHQGATF